MTETREVKIMRQTREMTIMTNKGGDYNDRRTKQMTK